MLRTKDILDEKEKILREISKEVTFPLEKSDLETIDTMMEYLVNSQNEKLSEKYDLRPGMGMSAVQVGVLKRYFVWAMEQEDGSFDKKVFINPKILSTSEELMYVGEGEGCLSINRPVEGIVLRAARITMQYQDINGKKQKIRLRELEAIVAQHEIDHLNGILFPDRIDKKNPYKDKNKYRAF